jgi:hypothetical protein
MENLGGHCLPTLCEAFDADDGRPPTVFLAYTIKGWGTPLAGHKDNHAGPDDARADGGLPRPDGRARGPGVGPFRRRARPGALKAFLARVPFFAPGRAPLHAAPAVPAPGPVRPPDECSRPRRASARSSTRSPRRPARRPHRHHLARCDRLDQPRRLGQPARPVRPRAAGRHLPRRAGALGAEMGVLARASISNSASPR